MSTPAQQKNDCVRKRKNPSLVAWASLCLFFWLSSVFLSVFRLHSSPHAVTRLLVKNITCPTAGDWSARSLHWYSPSRRRFTTCAHTARASVSFRSWRDICSLIRSGRECPQFVESADMRSDSEWHALESPNPVPLFREKTRSPVRFLKFQLCFSYGKYHKDYMAERRMRLTAVDSMDFPLNENPQNDDVFEELVSGDQIVPDATMQEVRLRVKLHCCSECSIVLCTAQWAVLCV